MNRPIGETSKIPGGTVRLGRAKRPLWRRPAPLIIAVLLVLFIVGGLRPKPIEIEVAKAGRGSLTVSVIEEGKTRIRERYVVSMPVAGYLNRVELEPGDHVEAGKTVLAEVTPQASTFLDPRERAQAEARVSAAEAAVQQRQADVGRVRALSDLAQKELKRGMSLKATGAISTKEWDALESEATTQDRAMRAAEFALRIAKFELEQSKAAMVGPQAADKSPEPLKIFAPVSGAVLNRFEESARPLTAGTPILEVGDPANLEVEIELLSQDAVGLKPGATVWVEQWGGDAPLKAAIRVVEPAAFTKVSALGVEEQRVRIIADLVGDPASWRTLGDRYRVEGRVVTWSGENVLQIPAGALFRRGDTWMTYRVEGSRAHLVPLKVGHHSGTAAEILEGLSEGDKVVVHPPDSLVDGSRVKARE